MNALEWFKTIGGFVFSWPVAVLVGVLLFRWQLMKLLSAISKAKIGPVELELNQIAEDGRAAVNTLDSVSRVMAESRLLELEITEGIFGGVFSAEQRQRMESHIQQLRDLTQESKSAPGE